MNDGELIAIKEANDPMQSWKYQKCRDSVRTSKHVLWEIGNAKIGQNDDTQSLEKIVSNYDDI